MTTRPRRAVLAYAGGPATTAAIRRLVGEHGFEVIALTLDVGQDRDLMEIRGRALRAGAVRAHVLDVREEFARACLQTILGSETGGRCPIGSAFVAPLVAKKAIEIAAMERADAIVHGETAPVGGTPIGAALRALAPPMEVIDLAVLFGESSEPADERADGGRSNVWGRVAAADAGEAAWRLTRSPAVCPDEGASLEIKFVDGTPVRINGIEMSLLEVIESVETIAGAHGVGRIVDGGPPAVDGGPRVRYEAPAAVVLRAGYGAIAPQPAADSGAWTGSARLRVRKGQCTVQR